MNEKNKNTQEISGLDYIDSSTSDKSDGTKGTGGTSSNSKDPKSSTMKNPPGTDGTLSEEKNAISFKAIDPRNEPPADSEVTIKDVKRPGYGVYDDHVRFSDNLNPSTYQAGLYWHSEDKNNEPVNNWIGSPLYVKALSHDEHSTNFGRLLSFMDSTGQWKEWLVPMALLAGSGETLRTELLNKGYVYSDQHRNHITKFIMQSRPSDRLVAATRTGWHHNEEAFVLPNNTLGDAKYRFQTEGLKHNNFGSKGDLKGWRDTVAAHCSGNPILILALCTGLAGTLLKPAKQQISGGSGLNLVGKSSRGKTTALQIAASLWGSADMVRNWSATGNGLEALAASLNDTLLPLDELSQSSPFEAGNMVYLLANGNGKQRASRTGGIKQAAKWRLMVLSSGERTLSAHMAEGGKQSKAGQEARLLDIPATERTYGVFDNLHGHESGSAFSNALKQATETSYGLAGQAFIKLLMEYEGSLPKQYNRLVNLPLLSANDGVETRAAETFALLAMAGELATEFGLTGWNEGEAIDAAITGFNLWRDNRGHGNTEDRHILQSIQDFIETHGDSRFSNIDDKTLHQQITRNRAGYWRDTPKGRVYYFTSAALKEAGAGYDLKEIGSSLNQAKWLVEKNPGGNTIRKSINGSKPRLYAVLPEGESHEPGEPIK